MMEKGLGIARRIADDFSRRPPQSSDSEMEGHASVCKNFADALLRVEKSIGECGGFERFSKLPEAKRLVAETVAWARMVENMFFGQ